MDLAGTRMQVPDDVIVDILSRLPIKYVLRFKCVCKSWLMITQQKFFIEKHQKRSQIIYNYKRIYDKEYVYADTLHGLVLERNFRTGLHRIRNPATKQVLQVTSQVFRSSVKYIIGYDPSTSLYKVVNFYRKGKTGINLGVRILTIGSDDDHAWRDLNVNMLFDYSRKKRCIYHKDVSYTATYSYRELEKTDILRLPMDGKSSMNIKVPQDFQAVRDFYSSNKIQMFILGDEKLSIGFMVRHILHVWVLEDYEKNVWSEKKIISLDYFKDYTGNITMQPSPNLSKLRLTIDNRMVEYDVHSTTYICLAEVPPGTRIFYSITPSLLSLKGMRSESESEDP